MIEIATGKDLQAIWTKLMEVIERTKGHTIQIKELQREIKKEKVLRTSPIKTNNEEGASK